jgi:hypothetical protein
MMECKSIEVRNTTEMQIYQDVKVERRVRTRPAKDECSGRNSNGKPFELMMEYKHIELDWLPM